MDRCTQLIGLVILIIIFICLFGSASKKDNFVPFNPDGSNQPYDETDDVTGVMPRFYVKSVRR